MTAPSGSRTWRMTSETCCWRSGGTSSRSARRSATSASSSSRASGLGSSAACSRASPARRSAAACAAWARSRSSESGSAGAIEGHVQGPIVEGGAGGPVLAHRGRQHQGALVAVDADHQLEADLLQRDLALLGEGQVHAQLRGVGADDELLREALVQDGARVALLEDMCAEAVEHLGADDLLAEVGSAQHGHRGEGGLDLLERRELALAPGPEVGAHLL